MSKLPTADKITDIDFCIKEGLFVNAIKMLRDITGMDPLRAKCVVELQTSGPRATMDRSGVLNACDGLWEYFKGLPDIQKSYEARDKQSAQRIRQLEEDRASLERQYSNALETIERVTNERDEYKSRLNAMRTTAGLEPLSTQQDGETFGDLLRRKAAADQLTSEAQRDGFYRETGLREFGSVQPIPTPDPEIRAMAQMVETLLELDTEARCRVLDYLQRRFE